ncbi:hypothetical protein RB195_019554 [Necator americanus]|uniref:Uncharacterized protein n=1 Tax=Necator americanus TaxID=51031 RepID=A0ABR1CFS8_NECAM
MSSKLPKGKKTMITTCTYNSRTLASEVGIEDLMMRARTIKCEVIGPIETRRRHPINAINETGEELFTGTGDSRAVGVLVNTSVVKITGSFEQLTTRNGSPQVRRCGSK